MNMRSIGLALALITAGGPASANCYEIIGCDDSELFSKEDLRDFSCQALWDVRNTIYKQNGYCFSTKRAIDYFGNDGCWISNQSKVQFNDYEWQNVLTIRGVEKELNCG